MLDIEVVLVVEDRDQFVVKVDVARSIQALLTLWGDRDGCEVDLLGPREGARLDVVG